MEPARKPIINTLKSVDRISALPDSIIGLILSLLPTKNAVATSTLSKRWEFLWRTAHNLDFSLEVLMEEQVEARSKKFVGYVNHVLAHHDAGVLNKFSLLWEHGCVQSHSTSWIKTAISRNVHELSITLGNYVSGEFHMPICVFCCDSVRYLQLNARVCLSAATMFCLPRLESLDLYGVAFQSDETFENLIRGCPVLNELRINMRDDIDDFRFVISSTSLKRLELNLGSCKYLKLDASSLEHLNLYGYNISVNFVQKKLTSLVEADLDFSVPGGNFSQDGIYNSMVDAVSVLDCAKNLTLSFYVVEAISYATTRLSTNFNRLVKLKTSIECCNWSSFQDLIQLSNNLEALMIHKVNTALSYDDDDHRHSNWTTPIEVPRCLTSSLKKIVLSGYYGDDDEREMTRYLLKHGSVLEVMEIKCHSDKREKIELLHEIREFPRTSSTCEVKLSGWKIKELVIKGLELYLS